MAYAYRPLDQLSAEIRLISFVKSKSNGKSTIRCRMKQIAYHDTLGWGDFTALSYSWGHLEYTKHIWVDEHPFKVTENLHDVLIRLQQLKNAGNEVSGTVPKWFWVDAICINQGDIHERNLQVPRMRYIFGGAKVVCCFPVLSALRAMKDTSDRHSWLRSVVEAINFMAASLPNVLSGPTSDSLSRYSVRSPLEDFWEDPYWERIWVVQEMALARFPVCVFVDGHCVPGKNVEYAAAFYGLLRIREVPFSA